MFKSRLSTLRLRNFALACTATLVAACSQGGEEGSGLQGKSAPKKAAVKEGAYVCPPNAAAIGAATEKVLSEHVNATRAAAGRSRIVFRQSMREAARAWSVEQGKFGLDSNHDDLTSDKGVQIPLLKKSDPQLLKTHGNIAENVIWRPSLYDAAAASEAEEPGELQTEADFIAMGFDAETVVDIIAEEKEEAKKRASVRLANSTEVVSKELGDYLHQKWLASPGHKRNILDPDASFLGVGIACVDGVWHGTQTFARSPAALLKRQRKSN